MREWLIDRAAHDVPLLMLIVMQGASFWMLVCASKWPAGFVGKMMSDADGKPSIFRFVVSSGFNIGAWVVMRDTLRPDGADPQIFGLFVAATFGAPVFSKALEKWNGQLPWAKGPPP
jgi:hypothetical protein